MRWTGSSSREMTMARRTEPMSVLSVLVCGCGLVMADKVQSHRQRDSSRVLGLFFYLFLFPSQILYVMQFVADYSHPVPVMNA